MMNIETIPLGLGAVFEPRRAGSIIQHFAAIDIDERQQGSIIVEVMVNDVAAATLNITFNQAGAAQGGHAGAAPGSVPFVAGDRVRTRITCGNAGLRFSRLAAFATVLYPD